MSNRRRLSGRDPRRGQGHAHASILRALAEAVAARARQTLLVTSLEMLERSFSVARRWWSDRHSGTKVVRVWTARFSVSHYVGKESVASPTRVSRSSRTSTEHAHDLVPEVADPRHHVAHGELRQHLELVSEQRFAEHGSNGFGSARRMTHARALARGEDHA